MPYKTICFQLIQDRPAMYDQLIRTRSLLSTVENHAIQLRDRHMGWKELLANANPDRSPEQIANEAMEIALSDLEDSLPPESPMDTAEPLSLDAAMGFIRRPTPPA
jgi:hypothetical protein